MKKLFMIGLSIVSVSPIFSWQKMVINDLLTPVIKEPREIEVTLTFDDGKESKQRIEGQSKAEFYIPEGRKVIALKIYEPGAIFNKEWTFIGDSSLKPSAGKGEFKEKYAKLLNQTVNFVVSDRNPAHPNRAFRLWDTEDKESGSMLSQILLLPLELLLAADQFIRGSGRSAMERDRGLKAFGINPK